MSQGREELISGHGLTRAQQYCHIGAKNNFEVEFKPFRVLMANKSHTAASGTIFLILSDGQFKLRQVSQGMEELISGHGLTRAQQYCHIGG